MIYDPEIHKRKSIRLQGYDYSGVGVYFVTVCVQGRECLFGEIGDGEMRLSDAGRMVGTVWSELPERFPNVALDEYMVMPNHFHGIVMIHPVGAGSPRPDFNPGCGGEPGGETPPLQRPTLGQIVGYFKYQAAKQVNIMRDNPGVSVWQRNYYERIIRDDIELAAIRQYIAANPQRWPEDAENQNHA